MTLDLRLMAESLGTSLPLATVVGSGTMAERLPDGNVAIAHLGNTISTGKVPASLKARPQAVPMAAGLYFLAAYRFPFSKHFTSQAVTIARRFSGTFRSIASTDVVAFIGVQRVATVLARCFLGWMLKDRVDA